MRTQSAESRGAEPELPIAFVDDDRNVIVNFGILTGREATQAEIDRLAQMLHDETGAGPNITITALRRQDYGQGIETVAHVVRVSADESQAQAVEATCREWARGCADDRRVEPLGL
jgi:hypothetical protein